MTFVGCFCYKETRKISKNRQNVGITTEGHDQLPKGQEAQDGASWRFSASGWALKVGKNLTELKGWELASNWAGWSQKGRRVQKKMG